MRAYILLAEGFECVEALTPIDLFNRAGVEVVRVAVGGELEVCSSHGLVSLKCDVLIENCNFEGGNALILPGGNPGYKNLRESEHVLHVVRDYYKRGAIVAAICGAPTVLAAASIAKAHRITCHASVVEQMREYWVLSDSVVRDGIVITGAGAASSWEFSLAILEQLVEPSTLLRVLEETMTIM